MIKKIENLDFRIVLILFSILRNPYDVILAFLLRVA